MFKEDDKVVVILSVAEAPLAGAKYLSVAYDNDTVIDVNIEDAMKLTDSLELSFLEYQQEILTEAIKRKRGQLASKGVL